MSQSTAKHLGLDYASSMARAEARRSRAPLCPHLDHASDIDIISEAIECGFTPVMYDGSAAGQRLVLRTGIDALAPAVGTAHGLYRGVPRIALDLIFAIRDSVNVPLVLHGGSDLSEALLRQAIRAGIQKVNVGTDLQVAHAKALRRALASDHVAPNMRAVHAAAAAALCDVARAKIRICSGIYQDFCGLSGKGGPHPQFPWVIPVRPIIRGFSTMHYPHP